MDLKRFEDWERAAKEMGSQAAIAQLVTQLRADGKDRSAFEATLMGERLKLGLPALLVKGVSQIPADKRADYEEAVFNVCRSFGEDLIAKNRLVEAFSFLDMIGETNSLHAALDRFDPKASTENIDAIIEIALGGVHPRKGIELIRERFGMCQAISAGEQVLGQETREVVRQECAKILVRGLHSELIARLRDEISEREPTATLAFSVTLLLRERGWLFENDNYHIDTSHLNAVVRMSRILPKCEELYLALQLCEYGSKLSERYRYADPPPFENVFEDTSIYLRTIAKLETEKGLSFFREKAEKSDPKTGDLLPAQVYISLLAKLDRTKEALEAAERWLNDPNGPNDAALVNEICHAAGRFDELARLAKLRGDAVSYMAGLAQQNLRNP